MKLIVGLGNPGRGYINNRHNTGFICLNYFARSWGIRFTKSQGKARVGKGELANNTVIVAKPQTYMNLSGRSVSLLVKKFNIQPDNLIVIHDDLDLPLGKMRIREGGGSGGHKGIDSIIGDLGRQDFTRVRVGIGRPVTGGGYTENSEMDVLKYVLGDFTPEEKHTIAVLIPVVSEAIYCLLTEGLTATMNKYN